MNVEFLSEEANANALTGIKRTSEAASEKISFINHFFSFFFAGGGAVGAFYLLVLLLLFFSKKRNLMVFIFLLFHGFGEVRHMIFINTHIAVEYVCHLFSS